MSATGELAAPARAIGIIRDEHRSLAAVMHAWMHALADARQSGSAADPSLMRAIVDHIRRFAVELHHPKEEEHLFRCLRQRTTTCNAELDELGRQHERDARLVAALRQRVEQLAAADATAGVALTRVLEEEVAKYAQFLWDHLGREEGVILPAAQRHLQPGDWARIDAAYAANCNPSHAGGDADRKYRQLFSRIFDLLPA
jgi:hemerythrin-like domain-containing protein